MSDIVVKYNPIYIVKDKKFDVESISQYNLYLTLDLYTFTLGVVDTKENRCLRLESYLFEDISDTASYLEQLEALYDDHHFLKVQFWNKVIVSVKNNCFSLVPKGFFNASEAINYLTTNCPYDASYEKVFHQTSNDIVSVFSCETAISNWFDKGYAKSKISYTHHSANLLECIMDDFALENQQSLYIHIDLTQVTIVIAEKGKLDYCNVLEFYTADELVNLILYVSNELKLDLESIETIIWFNSEADIESVDLLKSYFGNLFLGTRPYSLNFGYPFDEISDYQFFDLLSMHSCA